MPSHPKAATSTSISSTSTTATPVNLPKPIHTTTSPNPPSTTTTPKPTPQLTPHQLQVYALLSQIPPGRLTTYSALSRILNSSPRAIGNACRRNPFAPEIPCHRVISSNGYVGGYKGEIAAKVTKKDGTVSMSPPSGMNQRRKLELLREEGVEFTEEGMLIVPSSPSPSRLKKGKGKGMEEKQEIMFDGPWKLDVRV